ncbi:MAG: hypothetical protein J1F12_06630 [Muribaculaceae bacterium]|nr:hypothetical protein [Muribaculaceae bacterium]
MRKIIPFLALFALLCTLTGCKPTEKNYKSAYDAALNKREAAKVEIDITIPDAKFQQVDGPQLKEVDGVQVYVLNQRINPVKEGEKLPGQYNVAIGTYKMSTNCMAQAEALCSEGYLAFPAKEPDGMYFTIAGSFPSLSEAVAFYRKYQEGKNRVYVGLPDSPVIIFSPL